MAENPCIIQRTFALCFLLMLSSSMALAQPRRDRANPEHLVEFQAGAGVGIIQESGPFGYGPLVQVQARFALWHTVGLGAYLAAATTTDRQPYVFPVCARLNLSLPFWRSFEPTASWGTGVYLYSSRYAGDSHPRYGAHLALTLMIPTGRHAFGIEAAAHVLSDTRYTSGLSGMGTVAAVMSFRRAVGTGARSGEPD